MDLTIELSTVNAEQAAQALEGLAADLRRKAQKGDSPEGFIAWNGGGASMRADWKGMNDPTIW